MITNVFVKICHRKFFNKPGYHIISMRQNSEEMTSSGAPWSCGHIRLLSAPRDRGSNPRGGNMKKKIPLPLSPKSPWMLNKPEVLAEVTKQPRFLPCGFDTWRHLTILSKINKCIGIRWPLKEEFLMDSQIKQIIDLD